MTIELPPPIANYFAVDGRGDPSGVARHFTDDAVVRDEGHTYTGHAAIAQWKADSSTKYQYAVEPFAIANEAEATVVTAHLTGDFPGSPVDLRYRFALDGDRIASLEIAV